MINSLRGRIVLILIVGLSIGGGALIVSRPIHAQGPVTITPNPCDLNDTGYSGQCGEEGQSDNQDDGQVGQNGDQGQSGDQDDGQKGNQDDGQKGQNGDQGQSGDQ